MQSRAIAALVAALAMCTAGCGDKPKRPRPIEDTGPRTTSAPRPTEPTPPPQPAERTRGGVDLEQALDAAGEARARVWTAAQALSQDRAAGVAGLVAEKGAAKATVLALLASANFDELIGAMQVLQADGDPVGGREDAGDAVMGLLDHEVGAVRDAAWETEAKIADGAALAKLLPTAPPARKVTIVRLLAAWDGAPVAAALWALVTGDDAELALEAALAASAPGKTAIAPIPEGLDALLKDTSDARLRLGLIMLRRFGFAAGPSGPSGPSGPKTPKLSGARKEAIDRALASKDEALALEGVRSTLALPPEEREPLYEQLAADPRPAVRAVTAEVLAQIPGDASTKLVDKLLADKEDDVRMAAAAARAQLGTPAGKKAALAPLLGDANRGVRLAAAVSLARTDVVALAADDLVKQLEREDKEGVKAILEALATSQDRTGIGAVIGLMGDSKRALDASFALQFATKEDHGTDAGAWRAWLDKHYPAAPPAPSPTDPKAPEPKAPEKAPAPKAPDPKPAPKAP